MACIPRTYREDVLNEPVDAEVSVQSDPNCIARLKDYRSLMPLSQEANKPMFFLKPADGALGAHTRAVQDCYNDFERVARIVIQRAGIRGKQPMQRD